MSGHSKWHNIKRQKSINDAKRSQAFSKISRLVIVAAREGGGDPDANSSLRLAIQKAKGARMPKDNIERAIKKGTGELEGEKYTEAIYEGFGPEGGAMMVSCLTDNANRSVSEIRNIFVKSGGNLGAKGSTFYIFDTENKRPTFFIELDEEENAKKVDVLIETLEDRDDVQDVYHNYKFTEEN